MNDPFRIIPPIVALAGFAVSIVGGLGAGNPATGVIGRAIAALFVCLLMGHAVAFIARRIARDAQQEYERRKPLPPLMNLAVGSDAQIVEVPDNKKKQ
jgi:hypothetical protein